MNIRLANVRDTNQLIKMRYDSTIEDDESNVTTSYSAFEKECRSFLETSVFKSNHWYIWVAEEHDKILSHIYIELIQKVPRPGRVTLPFAYMTNVYTLKEYRNKGIGSKLLTTLNQWAKEQEYEFIIVWPSDAGINYYKKNGYSHCTEPMEYFPS